MEKGEGSRAPSGIFKQTFAYRGKKRETSKRFVHCSSQLGRRGWGKRHFTPSLGGGAEKPSPTSAGEFTRPVHKKARGGDKLERVWAIFRPLGTVKQENAKA